MARNASTGVYNLPTNASFNPATGNTVVDPADWNALAADFSAALTHASSTTRALYPTTGQVQDGSVLWGGTAGGTADALTITLTPAVTAYATGQTFRLLSSAANTTSTPTLSVNGLAAIVIKRLDGTALVAADIPAGAVVEVVYDGTAFRMTGVTPIQASNTGSATTTSTAASFSLTNLSNRVQSVAFTADAQSVLLPDARTCNIGGPLFIISNTGSRTFGVRSGNPNQFTSVDFASGTGWTLGTGWTIGSGVATKTAGVQADATQAITTVASTSYVVTFTVTTISGGTVQPVFSGGGADVVGTARNAPGTYTETIVSQGNTAAGFRGNSTFAGSIDNVSITLAVPTLLAVVPPGATAECSLTSAATIAGAWVIAGRDLQPALTICDATLASTLTQTVEVVVKMTDTLSLHFARNASGHPFVFAVDHSTYPATVGTAVLILAADARVDFAFRIADGKAAIFVRNVAASTSFAYNVSIAGTVCTVSTAATLSATLFTQTPGFTVQPVIAALGANSDQFIATTSASESAAQLTAQAVDCSGANPTAGSAVTFGVAGSGGVSIFMAGIYRVTATTALALYADDSGTAGTPFSVRGVVLSLSGTTVTVGTSAGVNDVLGVIGALPSCQLSATSYLVGYYQASGTLQRAVAVTVSGTTTTFGTPLTVESTGNNIFYSGGNSSNANRFQPNLYPLSTTTALYTYGEGLGNARHVVLTNSGGTLTSGTILYGVWLQGSTGGNFPQAADGFLAFDNTLATRDGVYAVTISGTSLLPTGVDQRGEVSLQSSSAPSNRFGLSGGVRGIRTSSWRAAFTAHASRFALYRFRANSPPIYLGQINTTLNGVDQGVPVELSPSRAAFPGLSLAQGGSTTAAVKLNIMEFIA